MSLDAKRAVHTGGTNSPEVRRIRGLLTFFERVVGVRHRFTCFIGEAAWWNHFGEVICLDKNALVGSHLWFDFFHRSLVAGVVVHLIGHGCTALSAEIEVNECVGIVRVLGVLGQPHRIDKNQSACAGQHRLAGAAALRHVGDDGGHGGRITPTTHMG